MEFMDAGSLDRLYGFGVPEEMLAKVATAMVKGLKYMKDELHIIHRGLLVFILALFRRLMIFVDRCKTDQCFGKYERRSETL